MSTQAVKYDALGTLIPPSEFCVHNATEDWLTLGYDGETVRVPSFTEVKKRNPKHPLEPHSMQDENGEYIPGTLILRDIEGVRPMADEEDRGKWSAAACIKHCLGIDVKTRLAYGVLALKGVSFVPNNASQADVARIATAGRARYLNWLENNAAETVAAHEERNAARVRHGDRPLAADKHVRVAQGVLEAARKRDGVKADNTIAELNKLMMAELPPQPDEEAEIKAALLRSAKELMAENELLGDAASVAKRAAEDPRVLAILREKFYMRKLQTKREEQEEEGQPSGVPTNLRE